MNICCKEAVRAERKRILEAMPKEEKLPNEKCLNLENHLYGSCFQCERIKGFNAALAQCKESVNDK